ncbi:D-alanine--D-alanine ligase [soil metagenome]
MFKNTLYKLTHWEAWDWRIKYIPLIPSWIWYCIRSRSFWFFTPSNPSLKFGGLDGISKKDMYDQLPRELYPKSIFISKSLLFDEVEKLFISNIFTYPVAVKPEIGRMGFMFRRIETLNDLKIYHEKMPVNYILQEFIHYPLEVSVFYYRFPGENKGTITGFIKKESLRVVGDGKCSLIELIIGSPRALLRMKEMTLKHKDKLNDIIPGGEIFHLSHALNLSRGGRLVSLEHEKDEKLLKVFDALSKYSKHFYYGRYDIKCASVEDLKNGKNFSILEYNGSGAEPHHIYGNGNTLVAACRILLQHWNVLYKISKCNYKKGINYWKFKNGWKFFKDANSHVKLLKQLDAKFPVS